MKIFITGSTGQVGFHMVEYLVKERPVDFGSPENIICLVRSQKKALELQEFGVSIVEGTLSDVETINKVMSEEGLQMVIHNAANIDTSASFSDYYRDNYVGTRNMLEAFAKSSAKAFVFASSVSVYDTFLTDEKPEGRKSVIFVTENTPIATKPKEGYSYTKIMCEDMIQDYVKQYPDKKFVICRIGPISGKRDRQILPNFITLLSFDFIPKLINGGRDLFVITNPYDVARAQIFLATNPQVKSGDYFNVSGGVITFRDLYDIVCDYYGFSKPILSISMEFFILFRPLFKKIKEFFPNNQFMNQALSDSAMGYIGKTYYYSTQKIEKLGFKFLKTPEDSLHEGLKDISKVEKYRYKKVGPFIVTYGMEFIEDRASELEEALKYLGGKVEKKKEKKKKRVKVLVRTGLCFLVYLLWVALRILYVIVVGE